METRSALVTLSLQRCLARSEPILKKKKNIFPPHTRPYATIRDHTYHTYSATALTLAHEGCYTLQRLLQVCLIQNVTATKLCVKCVSPGAAACTVLEKLVKRALDGVFDEHGGATEGEKALRSALRRQDLTKRLVYCSPMKI